MDKYTSLTQEELSKELLALIANLTERVYNLESNVRDIESNIAGESL